MAGFTSGPVEAPEGYDERREGAIGLLPGANAWLQNPGMGYYPNQAVAGFNPSQMAAWDLGMNGANAVRDAGANLAGGFGEWMAGGGGCQSRG